MFDGNASGVRQVNGGCPFTGEAVWFCKLLFAQHEHANKAKRESRQSQFTKFNTETINRTR